MSLWEKTQNLTGNPLQQAKALYGDDFPIEVRHFLADWIEEQFSVIDPQSSEFEQYAPSLFENFIKELELKASTFGELTPSKMKLMEAARMFMIRFRDNPVTLFRIIKYCLETEFRLVNEDKTMANLTAGQMTDPSVEIFHQLAVLKNHTQIIGNDLQTYKQKTEAFTINSHECSKINHSLNQLQQLTDQQLQEKEMMNQAINIEMLKILQLKISLSEKLKDILYHLSSLQSRILDGELLKWKREQQLTGNGARFYTSLDVIQDWCEKLASIIWDTRINTKEIERVSQSLPALQREQPDMFVLLLSQVTQLLSSLVTSTFVIEKQPPLVIKTNTKMAAVVRLLIGGILNLHMNPPHVNVSIISETQANILLKNEKLSKKEDSSGDILNHTGTMEYNQSSRQLAVHFRNMQLKKIKRAEKKGTESVMDEKFALLFSSRFSIGGGELVFQVWTLSLPVVVIVHGNQEPHAWATITWDNAFSEPGRVPFAVPDKVPWPQIAETLNMKFTQACGRPLTEENLTFLAEKAFRLQNVDYSNLYLSWAQFSKEPLPERNFTFWEWFYAVMRLTKDHLRGPWCDSFLHGFVRKGQVEEMLSECAPGTFLLRFSDSELGGVTIAWINETSEVFMVQPFTNKDFQIRGLGDRLKDLGHLQYLYPDIPKEQAFSKYYTPFGENQTNNGYVKPVLVTHLPGFDGVHTAHSYPNTPQNASFNPHSPHSVMSDSANGFQQQPTVLDL